MFERGNEIFIINELCDSLKSKIDWSCNIINDSIQEQRNSLLRRLEIAGFLFASIAFVGTIQYTLFNKISKGI